MSPSSTAADAFTLEYNRDQHLLVARWLQPAELPDLQASYEAILTTAVARGNCRRWLLDVRRRAVGNEQALTWFRQEFGPRLVPTLGGPVSVAYFAMINHEVARRHEGMQASIEEGELDGAHYRYFNREDEALAWLSR